MSAAGRGIFEVVCSFLGIFGYAFNSFSSTVAQIHGKLGL